MSYYPDDEYAEDIDTSELYADAPTVEPATDYDEIEVRGGHPPQVMRRERRPRESRIPANAPRPQDHLPKQEKSAAERVAESAVEREANGINVLEFEFDGVTYRIPSEIEDWPVDAVEAFENDRVVTAMRHILEGDGWVRFQAKGYRMRKAREMFDAIAKLMGFERAGN